MVRRSHLSCCVGLQRMMQGTCWKILPTPSAPAEQAACCLCITSTLQQHRCIRQVTELSAELSEKALHHELAQARTREHNMWELTLQHSAVSAISLAHPAFCLLLPF